MQYLTPQILSYFKHWKYVFHVPSLLKNLGLDKDGNRIPLDEDYWYFGSDMTSGLTKLTIR